MHNVEVSAKWVWQEAGKRDAGTGFLGRGKLGRDNMALGIMSKCGEGGVGTSVGMTREGGVGIGYAGISGSRA